MQGMYARLATARLRQLAGQFPAVLILGARQVGKTTLARLTFPDLPYCDLEDPATQALFADDPRFQLEARPAGYDPRRGATDTGAVCGSTRRDWC